MFTLLRSGLNALIALRVSIFPLIAVLHGGNQLEHDFILTIVALNRGLRL